MGEGGYRQINKTLNACAFEEYLSTQQKRLPKLQDVEHVSPRVIRVLGQNAGKVMSSPRYFRIETRLFSHQPHQLTVASVHASRNEHLHRWYGLVETHHRYWPRHPSMGKPTLCHPQNEIHHLVPRTPNPLARRSHWRSTRPSSPLPLHLYLNS